MRSHRNIAAGILFAASCLCAAQDFTSANKAPQPPGVGWASPTRITITTRSPEIPEVELLTFHLSTNGDTLINVAYPQESARQDRQLLVVDRRWLATKDAAVERGREIDVLDGPMLTMQLVLRFLEHSLPAGPSTVRGRQPIQVTENFKPIRVNTVSAEGGWEAPWTLRGMLERKSPTQVAYDFVVLHSEAGDPNVHTIRFSGIWESNPADLAEPDAMSLRGWKIYKLGPLKRLSDKGTIVEFGAEEQTVSFATLGDLRSPTSPQGAGAQGTSKKLNIPASLTSPLQRY